MKDRSAIRWMLLLLLLGAAGVMGVGAFRWSRLSAAPATVTFSRDVAPILYGRCAECHRPGETAPMSLLSYRDVRPWAKSIREKVVSREMPPWYADPNHGDFINEARLTSEEIETLRQWVDGGAKEGNPKDLPPVPKPRTGEWRNGEPDVVLSMSEAVEIPAEGTVPYKYFAVPTNFTEDKYVQFAEIKRGAPSVVHHVIISVREPEQGVLPPAGEIRLDRLRGANPEDPQANNRNANQRRGTNPDGMLVGWAPGMSPLRLRDGNAKLIRKGSVLVFQMHYTTNGEPATDITKVGLWFAKGPVDKRVITKGVMVDPRQFVIPAGDPNYVAKSTFTFPEDAHIHMFMPHMHVRGKSFEYTLVYPDGTSKVLLRVPKYDFNWQLGYFVREPIAVPKGSRIDCVATFDNSTNNPYNPDPTRDVRWGDQTWEEMMIGWIDYTLDGQNLRAVSAVTR
ncbi:MAG: thiol-disulfide isomerase [Blastocatellia bacterium]|jgi:hypothetical protein